MIDAVNYKNILGHANMNGVLVMTQYYSEPITIKEACETYCNNKDTCHRCKLLTADHVCLANDKFMTMQNVNTILAITGWTLAEKEYNK